MVQYLALEQPCGPSGQPIAPRIPLCRYIVLKRDTCSENLPAGGSCKIIVGYKPGSVANLVISDNAPGSPQVIPIGGVTPP